MLRGIILEISKNLKNNLLIILAGAILPLAFAPFNYYWIAILSPIILLKFWSRATPRQAFKQGLYYGLAEFGVGISWVYISIYYYGNTGFVIALLLTSLLCIYLALFPALCGYLFSKYFNNKYYILIFPALWVLVDAFRGILFTGFPWLFLGYSQVTHYLGNYAPLINIYGVTFLVLLSSSLLYSIFDNKFQLRFKLFGLGILLTIWGVGWYLNKINWTQALPENYDVRLIQGNIPQELKWDPEHVRENLAKYLKLTEENLGKDIIIWPEAALTIPLPYSQAIVDHLKQRAAFTDSNLLIGAPVRNPKNQYYNAILAIGSDAKGIYYKRHLLPFGDYLPLSQWLRGLIGFFDLPMSSFSSGNNHQALLKIKQLGIASFICYEIAFPNLIFNTLQQAPADLILTISNDTWFGKSMGPDQHLQIAQMRALETGRMVIRATNSGITAIIDNHGRIVQKLPQFTMGVLRGSISGYAGNTVATQIGVWPVLILLLSLLIWARFLGNFGELFESKACENI